MSEMTPRDIESLIQLFELGDWTTMELRFGDSDLFLSRDPIQRASWSSAEGLITQVQPRATLAPSPTTAAAETKTAAVTVPTHAVGHVVVKAPSMGTFYRAPKPGAQPFIEVGHRVEATTELCLIEVMKLFTTLRAGAAGVVSKILVSDGELIERGQSLFAIDPNG
jgi:acetyl-CoA carboxylase biotin carboxyl carrier protein